LEEVVNKEKKPLSKWTLERESWTNVGQKC